MASILNRLLGDLANPYLMAIESINPVVKDLPLMSSPIYVVIITALYLLFCIQVGPSLMKNRKPYELEKVMIAYNIIQMVMNLYLLRRALFDVVLSPNFNFILTKDVDESDELMIYVYYYFLNKLVDLMDTIFMVLRKKNSQITFLHLYHHTMIALVSWVFVAYAAASFCAFFGAINTFVHVIMYFYYLLTAAKPEYKKSVWWKRHITQMQLGQFIIVTLHATANVLQPSSIFPKALVGFIVPQGIIMFFLFWDFYKKAYNKKKNIE